MLTPLTDADPREVGPFGLQSRIGAGGMGTVYLGFTKAGKPVAIKVPSAALATDPEFRGRFRNEVSAARKVRGGSVAEVIDADVDSERPWMATEYVEGTSLAEAVGKRGPLEGRLLAGLAVGLADALVAIHEAGVVHRDLKPSNILMAWDGPKVIDFGIARSADGTSHTRTGMLIGTLAWMAPEQLRGEPAGPSTDIFAWGACLLFAAMGRQPFRGEAPEVVAFQIMSAEPDLSALPPSLAPLVARALDKDATRRPTANELVAHLAGREVRDAEDADEAAETMLAQNWSWGTTPPAGGVGDGRTATPGPADPRDDFFFASTRTATPSDPRLGPAYGEGGGGTAPGSGSRRRADSKVFIGLGVALLLIAGGIAALLLSRSGSAGNANLASLSGTGTPSSAATAPASSPASVGPTQDPTTSVPTTSVPTKLPTSAAATPPAAGTLSLDAAHQLVLAKGYTPSNDTAFNPANTLNVILGRATDSGDGYNQYAFFFANGKLLGTDTKDPSATISLISARDNLVILRYPLYRPADPMCCPSAGTKDVRYEWDGTSLQALDPIPDAASSAAISRR